MNKWIRHISLLMTIGSLTACVGVKDENLITTSYEAADTLLINTENNQSSHRVNLKKDKPIVVASFVNVDNMLESSRLGRIVSEQFSSRLSQQGYYIVELKLRKNIFIKNETGELLLSREIKDISKNHGAQAVVIGTYAAGDKYTYVSTRIVNPDNNMIIASHDYRLPMGRGTRRLLE